MQAYDYPDMLEMIKSGKLKPEKLIEKTILLKESITTLPNMDKTDLLRRVRNLLRTVFKS